MTHTQEDWLNVETSAEGTSGKAVAALLQPLVEALEEAPNDRRYDFELNVYEREVGNSHD